MRRRRRKYKERRKIHTSIKVFVGCFLASIIWFCMLSSDEKKTMTPKNELILIEGKISSYKYYKSIKRRSSTEQYVITVENSPKTYVVLEICLDEFNREVFEQEVKIGDDIKIYMDKNMAPTYRDGAIYEIWSGEKCYFSYEQFAKCFEDYIDGVGNMKIGVPLATFLLGVYGAFEIWRREKDSWHNAKTKYRM